MSTAVLTVDAVSRTYGDRQAVIEASLILDAGRITCLLGPSGSGKSTLLRLIAGLEPVDSGVIRAGEQVLSRQGHTVAPERRGTGLVFQDYALFPHLSVLDNVRFGLMALPRAERRVRAMAALGRVDMADRARDWPHNLSGGEQQRVALARSLVREPAAILLDEPFSGLDAHLKTGVRDALTATLRAAGAAVLIVTHDPAEALMIADTLVLMEGGRVIQSGDPADCYDRPASVAAARLLGEINALPVEVVNGTAATPWGPLVAPGLADGPARLLLRPQDLAVGGVGPEGSVTAHRFAGHFSEIGVSLGGQILHLHAPGVGPRPGERVRIKAELKRARVVAG